MRVARLMRGPLAAVREMLKRLLFYTVGASAAVFTTWYVAWGLGRAKWLAYVVLVPPFEVLNTAGVHFGSGPYEGLLPSLLAAAAFWAVVALLLDSGVRGFWNRIKPNAG